MPTGYTNYIVEDKNPTMENFMRGCAHAFLVHLRDSSISDKLKPMNNDCSYEKDGLVDKAIQLNELIKMSNADYKLKLIEDTQLRIKNCTKYIKESANTKKKLEKMLREVKAWTPPTDRHNNLKEFAIEQINSTIAFDCCSSYYKSELLEAKQQLSQLKKNDQAIIASMKAKDIDELVKDIARLGKDIQKNRANVEDTNEWIDNLEKSL